jgi:hypothetical protein
MTELWTTLVTLALATALLPIQLTITILMLRAPGGRARAGAWIAGMTVVRLAQFAVFGVVLDRAVGEVESAPSPVEGALLLLVGVLLLVAAGRKLADQPDDDAPPPRWMTTVAVVSPGRAFLSGAGLVGLSPKLWAFTLGAIGAIADTDLAGGAALIVFVVWIVLAQALHLLALLAAVVAPARAEVLLGAAAGALERNSRPLTIGVSAVFGAWFLLKALAAFGFGPTA